MKKYLELVMIIEDDQLMERLIAQLPDFGFYGFLEESNILKAYHDQIDNSDHIRFLEDMNISFTHNIIDEENWNTQWESSFDPVVVDDFAIIRADFHPKQLNVLHEIVITPKMSFGTGHHATTLGMIRLMRNIDFRDKKVMDFGTGTGILAILSEKLGATEIDAIDIDDWSISNSMENIVRNECRKIRLWKDDKLPEKLKYDVLLANINLHVLVDNRKHLFEALNSSGTLIISGIMKKDEKEITDTFFEFYGEPHTTLNINEWLMFIYSKK